MSEVAVFINETAAEAAASAFHEAYPQFNGKHRVFEVYKRQQLLGWGVRILVRGQRSMYLTEDLTETLHIRRV